MKIVGIDNACSMKIAEFDAPITPFVGRSLTSRAGTLLVVSAERVFPPQTTDVFRARIKTDVEDERLTAHSWTPKE